MIKLEKQYFNEAYMILKDAFPAAELRQKEKIYELFIKEELTIYGLKHKDEIVAVLLCWHFDDFLFLENFAVKEKYRGIGYGSQILSDIKSEYKGLIILEVEKPYDDYSQKRICFYEKNGFKLNPFGYNQPPFVHCDEDIPLWIMSTPDLISKEVFYVIKKMIFDKVYKKKLD